MQKFINRRQGYAEAEQDDDGHVPESETQLVPFAVRNPSPTSIAPTISTLEKEELSSLLNQNTAKSENVSNELDKGDTLLVANQGSDRQYYEDKEGQSRLFTNSRTYSRSSSFSGDDEDEAFAKNRASHRNSITSTSENSFFHDNVVVSLPGADLTTPPQIPADSTPLERILAKFKRSKYFGFAILALSAFFFSVMSLFVSLVHGRIPSMQMVWWRCFAQFSLALIGLRYKGVAIWGPSEKQKWLILRGLVGMVSLSCFYFALTNLPLSDATVLFFTAPIFTGILGRVFLKEPYDVIDFGGVIMSTIGVVFVSRPSFIFGDNADDGSTSYTAAQRTVGVIIALVGAFISSLVYICIRKVGKGVDALVLVQYMGAIGIAITPFSTLFTQWHAPEGYDIIYTIMVGLAAFCGQCLFNAGVQIEKAGPASLIRNLDVVFAFFWQITVEGVSPNMYSGIGTIIILASVIGIGMRNWRRQAAPTPAIIPSIAPVPSLEDEIENKISAK